ncbi:MAG: PfkB family carbohydrate kinase [Synergistaceae bacterium]|jgi:1-phosphofructokinase family hexose kinase|nr:PfkB family carbohydrate kinase [Synergistaceae bacterium]
MIITITPNPAMDESYVTDEFSIGHWYRAKSVLRSPGGRGINVSIILKQLGYDSVSMGFLAGHVGEYIRDDLLSRGITTNFINIKGENRTNTFIRDSHEGPETAVTEEGPEITPDALKRFFWQLEHLLPRATAVHMGGSLLPGLPETFFRDTIDIVKKKNIPVYVDSAGPELTLAIEALPTVVQIDHRFINIVRNIPLSSLEDLTVVSKKIFDEGVDWIVTSNSEKTNLFCTPKGMFLAEMVFDKPRTYRAAGDALVAGLILARQELMSIDDAIKFAMSCVIQTVCSPQKGLPSRTAVESTLGNVTVNKI